MTPPHRPTNPCVPPPRAGGAARPAIATPPSQFNVRVEEVAGCASLQARGELSSDAAARLRGPLKHLLLDRGKVVVNVTALRVRWPPALAVFPATLAEVGGWPLARLVLLGADAALTTALRAGGIHRAVPLAEAWSHAHGLLDTRPAQLGRYVHLPAGVQAPALARVELGRIRSDWNLAPALRAHAEIVVTELVRNAVEHAQTASVLAFTLSPVSLHVAVRDTRPITDPHAQGFDRPSPDRMGLARVRTLARAWGISPHDDGKTVWAVLERPLGGGGLACECE